MRIMRRTASLLLCFSVAQAIDRFQLVAVLLHPAELQRLRRCDHECRAVGLGLADPLQRFVVDIVAVAERFYQFWILPVFQCNQTDHAVGRLAVIAVLR